MTAENMMDFEIIKAFQDTIQQDPALKHVAVFIHRPHMLTYPCIVIELEEVWTSLKLGLESGYSKVKLKVSILSQKATSKESVEIADRLRHIVDGRVLQGPVEGRGAKGVVRLLSSVIEMQPLDKPVSVQQFFDILIRNHDYEENIQRL